MASLQSRSLEDFGPRWFGLQFNPGEVKRATRELTQRGFENFCPIERRVYLRRGAKVISDFPLLFRYMFVRMDLGQSGWRRVLGTPGVDKLFPIRGEFPIPASTGAVEELIARQEAGEFNHDATLREYKGPTLEHGDDVRVCNGPFTSFNGLVDLSEEGRFKVLVSIFGRTTPVQMEPADVEFVGRVTPPRQPQSLA